MAASDALIVGEDWISEHYFTTDAKSESFQAKVTERRKLWDEDAKIVREDGDPASKVDTVRSRFLAARGSLSADLATLLADAPAAADGKLPDLYERLRRVLGYNTGEYTLKQAGPVIRVTTPDLNEAAPLVIAEARAADTVEDLTAKDGRTLLTPYEADETTTYTSVARLLSALFVADDGPEFALVLAGRWLLVTERARWAEGRYLAVDLQLVCDRNDAKSGGEIDRALTCVERRVTGAGRGGRHLVAWRPRGFRQAHRGRVPGPARGRTAFDRDHRQRGGSAPQGPRARPAAARAGAAARPAGAAVPIPDPLPAICGGVARARGAACRRGGVRPGLRA